MRLRRLLALALVLSLVGGVTAFADDTYDTYKGKTVKVTINNQDTGATGIVMDDKDGSGQKVILPLKTAGNALQALVQYDDQNQTIDIYKPDVHMTVIEESDPAHPKLIGDLARGDKYNIYIVYWIDSLQTSISDVKVAINDPYGNEVYSEEKEVKKPGESLVGGTTPADIDIKYSGKYVIKFYMKQDASDDYTLVSKRVINARAQSE